MSCSDHYPRESCEHSNASRYENTGSIRDHQQITLKIEPENLDAGRGFDDSSSENTSRADRQVFLRRQ
jgi:hypothetical protein